MRVLITRPEPDAIKTAEVLKARGHEAVLAPFFVVNPRSHLLALGPDAFLATSANALRALNCSGVDRAKPMFTVGNATATEAKTQGFTDIRSAAGDSTDLAQLVRSQLKAGMRLGYLTGRPRNDEAIQALSDIYSVETVETYETLAADILPAVAMDGLESGTLNAVLHFSPRAAVVFAELVDKAGFFLQADQILHVFISKAAVQPRFCLRAIAKKPTLESMLENLEKTS
jgi:uroporphyrinogen-III synthase